MGNFDHYRKEEYLSYDTKEFDFHSIVSKIFGNVENLSQLHELDPESTTPGLITFENDQATSFHKTFYRSPHLDEFLQNHIAPMFKGEKRIIYQKKPTFRVHLPNNLAVGAKHRDFDYHHPSGELNFWLPFTSVSGNNGIWVESEPEVGDFHSIELEYGQIFRFYGNKCWHYNEPNDTGSTRVSIDFRIIPGSDWEDSPSSGSSVKSGLRFTIGSYYDVLSLE